MIKILIAIPCLYGYDHTKEAIESVINKENVSVLLIDNGAEPRVKELLQVYKNHAQILINETNVFVNPAWQQAINIFLQFKEFTHLVIMNSDLIMQGDWSDVCVNRWAVNNEEILIPTIVESKLLTSTVSKEVCQAQEVSEGTPGVFITLSRKQAEAVSPLPKELKIWFGDNWIYDILRTCGYKTVIPINLICFHYWSQNVQRLAGVSEMIEEDKRQWALLGERKQKYIDLENNKKIIDGISKPE